MDQCVGTVVWLNRVEGYGFIARDGAPDVFCDFKLLQVEDYSTLRKGESIEFDVQENSMGSHARNVRRFK